MPDQVTNYQCPNCGGPLHFDTKEQKLKCDHCGSTFTADEVEAYYKEHNDQAVSAAQENTAVPDEFTMASEGKEWNEEEASHLRAYICPSCGANLMCDENTAATSCPYCGNPTIVPSQFAGALKPDYVIPFRLEKKEAVARLEKHYKGKPFLPRAFSADNHIEEIKGVYVPFWLYGSDANIDASYHATRVHTHRQGDDEITITEHYRLVRKATIEFNNVPADASSKMPDEFMDSIEPFDYKDMVPFEMSYLAGYLADRYDVSAEEDAERANARMHSSAKDAIHKTTIGYSSVIPEHEYIHFDKNKVGYAFLPVWVLSTKWHGKNYLFTMNGQTGKMVGNLPVDKGKAALTFLLITLIGMAILFLIFFVIMKGVIL